MKGGAVYAEILKNLKNNLKRINLMKGETKLKVEKKNKKLILKMVTSVIIVVAGLFQKQLDNEDEKGTTEDDYMF